ncbi:MAG: FAD-dependent oxidoreductase [Planctomycetota bacterium]|jgi:2-polyprenyl-6-methoxyphenol hydroxylase-like FAD-dependent oxidoreductase
MFGRKKADVLIVGAGPVGLFMALQLVKRGIRVQLMDKEIHRGTRSYALALHAASLDLLAEVGVLDQVLERCYRVNKIGLYDGAERMGELRVSDLKKAHPFLAVLRQHDLEGILEDALAKVGVKVMWNHEISQLEPEGERVLATVDRWQGDSTGYVVQHTARVVAKTKTHEFPFVIGADGHGSTVRRRLGIGFESVGKPVDFAVFEFKTEFDFDHELRLVMGEHGTNVCWPMPDGWSRWSFEVRDTDQTDPKRVKDRDYVQIGAEHFPGLSDDRLKHLLSERAPWFDGKVDPIGWRLAVRFGNRLADSFGSGRVWLVGDAGHVAQPAGVQSMNVGLREARDLASKIAGIIHDGDPLSTLESYGEERRAEWRKLLGIEARIEPLEYVPPWLANKTDALLASMPASGKDLTVLSKQLGLKIGHKATTGS